MRDHNAKEGLLYEELKRLARAARDVIPEEAHLFAPSSHARTRLPSRGKISKAPSGDSKPAGAAPSGPASP